jgi:hypothetical protein
LKPWEGWEDTGAKHVLVAIVIRVLVILVFLVLAHVVIGVTGKEVSTHDHMNN